MAPKAKSTNVYIVASSGGIDSVHAELESAQARVTSARSEGQTSVRVEVHSVIGSSASAASTTASASAAAEDKKTTTATPAKPKADPKPKDAKPKEPKSETKPKETKPKEPKADAKSKAKDDGKAKTDTAAEGSGAASSAAAGAPPQPTLAPAPAPSSSSTSAPAPSAPTSTPAKPAPKTIPADEQRATNAKKGTKAANEDLPANVQTLLNNSSDTLNGLVVVVTGVPPTLGRKNAEKLVENHGAKLGKSITGKTSLVILGNDAGPKKLEQISEHKIETIDEDGLIKKLEAGGSPKKRAAEDNLPKKAAKKAKE